MAETKYNLNHLLHLPSWLWNVIIDAALEVLRKLIGGQQPSDPKE